jgi:ribosomal protein L40E
MDNDNLFDPVNRMVEFGMGLAIAQQMVKSMNMTNENVKIPGNFQDFHSKFLSRICQSCGISNPVESRFCSKCGDKLLIETIQSKLCPKCNTSNDYNSKYCIECGETLVSNACSKCNTENPNTAKFCKNCGNKLQIEEPLK